MTDQELTIQVHVRRTGEIISIPVRPSEMTFGDILQAVCTRIKEPEPSHYYIAMNYEREMENDLPFDTRLINERFHMNMRTYWIIKYIAEQTLQREKLIAERNAMSDGAKGKDEDPTLPPDTTEQNRAVIGDVDHSATQKITKRDIQKYLHAALGKAFDIVLMGSPRVGKSTLINAILKKDMAKTSPGRNPFTKEFTYYEYTEKLSTLFDEESTSESNCLIRIWDAPGIENWDKVDVSKYIENLVKEKNPICLIYCASPGCFARSEHMKMIIDECYRLNLFVALVVTNMYASNEVDDILETYQTLLSQYSNQTKVELDVFYYGSLGLCTTVNSVEFIAGGNKYKPTGVDNLMVGIMNSLSDEKLLQWCFAVQDNHQFWIRAHRKVWNLLDSVKSWFDYKQS